MEVVLTRWERGPGSMQYLQALAIMGLLKLGPHHKQVRHFKHGLIPIY